MTLHGVPVLLVTRDDAVWQHWRQLETHHWLPARGYTWDDVIRWHTQKRSLVILDASLPQLANWDDPAWLQRFSEIQVVVASTRPGDDEAAQALAAGASGYLHTYSPAEVLSRALNSVMAGSIWAGRSIVSRLLREVHQRLPQGADWSTGLTAREKAVAKLAAFGDSNQDIGDSLGISERTVRAHLSAAFEKLGVSDRLLLALKVHGIN